VLVLRKTWEKWLGRRDLCCCWRLCLSSNLDEVQSLHFCGRFSQQVPRVPADGSAAELCAYMCTWMMLLGTF
jgi:hypothetical protein